MQRSFDAWADAFPFSNDMEELERSLSMSPPTSSNAQRSVTPSRGHTPPQPAILQKGHSIDEPFTAPQPHHQPQGAVAHPTPETQAQGLNWEEHFAPSRPVAEPAPQAPQNHSSQPPHAPWDRGEDAPPESPDGFDGLETLASQEKSDLDYVSGILAEAVVQRVAQGDVLSQLLKLNEVQRDNEILSSQVRRLLHDQKQWTDRVQELELELNCYKRVVGNLYLKLE